jgi:hypothetical protein
MQYIDDLKQRADDVEARVDQLERTIESLQERIAYLDSRVQNLNRGFGSGFGGPWGEGSVSRLAQGSPLTKSRGSTFKRGYCEG